mgnify:CR=1 FL=1
MRPILHLLLDCDGVLVDSEPIAVEVEVALLREAGIAADAAMIEEHFVGKDVTAMVLGGHGDQMVSVVSATTVGGVPLRKLLGDDTIQKLVERTAKGGGELVSLLGTSAWYAPGAAAAQMVDSIMLDEKRVLPCTAYLEGEYGIDDLYMGVPVKLGAEGIEEIYELDLSDEERQQLRASAEAVRDVVGVLTT